MQNPFKERLIEQKDQKGPDAVKLRKLGLLEDMEHVEIKKLVPEDTDQVFLLMRKTLWEASREQVADVIKAGMSYGAYVERMLVGAGLAWPAHYNEKKESMSKGDANALYLEDVALLLAYEGKGIRRLLIEEREKAARASGLEYIVALISPDWPEGALEKMIQERGNKIEKEYLACGYRFIRAKDGIMAFKNLVQKVSQ